MANLQPSTLPNHQTDFPTDELVNTALEISRQRANTLRRVKTAIRNRDLAEADRLITELVPDEKERSGVDQGIDRITGRRESRFDSLAARD